MRGLAPHLFMEGEAFRLKKIYMFYMF